MRRTLILPMVAVASISLLTACGDEGDNKSPAPKSLVGEWYQTNSEETGVYMTASVYKTDSIQIHVKTRDSTSIYWMGSFQVSDKDPAKDFKLVSKGDPDALSMSIFGSPDETKPFTYEDGEFSYKFSMLGKTSTVRLSKLNASASGTGDQSDVIIDTDKHKTKKPNVKGPEKAAPAARPAAPPKTKIR